MHRVILPRGKIVDSLNFLGWDFSSRLGKFGKDFKEFTWKDLLFAHPTDLVLPSNLPRHTVSSSVCL